ALLIATPLSIAIGLYLSELAPRGARTVIASLVELLAAIPSVVLGLWGILVLGPFVGQDLEPWLDRHLGFIPLFGGSPENAGMLVAVLVLAIMIVAITSSICRELFLGVPTELAEQYQGAVSNIQIASLVYLAAILLVISLLVNLTALVIVRRFSHERAGGS